MSDFTTSMTLPSVQAVPPGDLQDFWNFKHSLVNASLPLLACSLFFTCSVTHLCIALITKRLYMLPLTVGCILGILGEIFKVICIISTPASIALNYYVLYSITTDLTSCLFLTSIGWMVRRMMSGSAPSQFPWPARAVSHQIITFGIGAFALQSYGLLVQANPSLTHYWRLGNMVTVAGSAIEVLNILMVWLSLWIVMRKRRLRLNVVAHQQSSPNFSALPKVVAGSVGFVLIRSLSRIILHLRNEQLEPFRNELLIFLLEGLPLALCALFLIIFHPCRYDGGIPEQTPSFFSPENPHAGVTGSEMQESRNVPIGPSLSHLDKEDMGPFWTIPLSPHQSPHGKRSSIHVRLAESDGLHGCPSSPPLHPHYVGHRSSLSKSDYDPAGMTSRMESSCPAELHTHPARFSQPNSANAEFALTTNEICVRRRTQSAVLSFDENPLGINEFHQDRTKNTSQSPLDAYSISSYYDDASKNFAKSWADEMFKDRNLETSLGPWDEESVYSTEESGKESRS